MNIENTGKTMHCLLHWITGFLPARYINDGNVPYLERYYLFTVLGWRFYLHRFVGSDPDRGLHDHPWSRAFSIILSGWYWEETRMGKRKVSWFNSLRGDSFHRVVLPVNSPSIIGPDWCAPCWTLFFHKAGNVKPWGFWRPHSQQLIDALGSPADGAIFEPYRYTREGSQKHWWLTAPVGRELREAVIRKAGDV